MAAPTNLTFPTVAYNSIILNWTPGLGSNNTLIIRKQGSIPTSRTDGTQVYLDNGNAFIDTGLNTNTQYCYAVYGTDGTEYTEPVTGCVTTLPWVSGYQYSKSHTITGSTSGAVTDYQMKFRIYRTTGTDSGDTVYLGTKVDPTYKDIYFTASDKTTALSYWIESSDSTSATVWVKIPSIPASPSTTTVYLYYGNPSAVSASNGDNTFIFFDHFEGASLDAGKWNGVATISNSLANIPSSGGISTKQYLSSIDTITEARINIGSAFAQYHNWGIFTDQPNGMYRLIFYPSSNINRSEGGNGSRTEKVNNSNPLVYGNFAIYGFGRYGSDSSRYMTTQVNRTLFSTYSGAATDGAFLYDAYFADVPGLTYGHQLDWVLIRKNISSEPSHSSWSSELLSSLNSSDNPGLSCKSIIDTGQSLGSGVYWIDPNGGSLSDEFQAYCDMTTDGGGWVLLWAGKGVNWMSDLGQTYINNNTLYGIPTNPEINEEAQNYFFNINRVTYPYTQVLVKTIHTSFTKKLYMRADDLSTNSYTIKSLLFALTCGSTNYTHNATNTAVLPQSTSTSNSSINDSPFLCNTKYSYRLSQPGMYQDSSNCAYWGRWRSGGTDNGCNGSAGSGDIIMWSDSNGRWWYVR
jgi:hypothetical protein